MASRVMVAGGLRDGNPHVTASAEIYDPATGLWSRSRSMSTPRSEFTANLLNDGRVFAAGGGSGGTDASNIIEEFDPASGKWRILTTTLATARRLHTTTNLLDGSLIIAGGISPAITLVPTAELFVRPR